MSKANTELARRGYEAVLRGDFDVIRDLLDPDVRWHGGDPSAESACRNREQALAVMHDASGRRGIGELVEIVDAGERVVVIMRPSAQPGERTDLVANVTTFRDGKVVEMVHYADPQDALDAVGLSAADAGTQL